MHRKGQLLHSIVKWPIAAAACLALFAPTAGNAQGDLLIAPTRLVLDGRRGTSLISFNDHSHLEAAGPDLLSYR